MKKTSSTKISILLLFFLVTLNHAISQEKVKKGFGFGAIPAVSFDSDLGFQYGAIVNLYHYGDGSRYPKYNHSLYLEYSRYTKGSSISRIMYDSDRLIPKVRTTVDIAYLTDKALDFYGFNGYQSRYDASKKEEKATRFFYKQDRNMFRAKADFQGMFGKSNFGWVAGYTFYNFDMDTIHSQKLSKTHQETTLFELYTDWGIITPKEAKGGSINYIKLGFKYDSRDQQASPMKGIWTEAVIQTAPKFINQKFPHTKFALIHRQYFTLIPRDMSLAYRLHYQTSIGNNHVPYYAQPLVITSFLTAATSQGLGGKTTIRGVLRNRIVSDAFAFGNFEWRYKFLRFQWLNQNFYLGANVFFDTGVILRPIKMDLSQVPEAEKEVYFKDYKKGKFHSAIGAGIKIGWNENFIVSAEFGKAFDKQDGNTGFYVGLNYLF
ncbi:BamA/TamA family outer membrane protein [Paludibacteraceae bacterium OttesenSCG-928-F17]|nr:BamA/TamA family outer membrane protein [Paludibacteraceae bacterium OttesenSCG-928-F17]